VNHQTANIELREDDDGRRYWYGAEDGWKEPTELGEDGVLMLSVEHFAVGTKLYMEEPRHGAR